MNRLPDVVVLSRDEQVELARAARAGDAAARERLILSCLPLAWRLAGRFVRLIGRRGAWEDYRQVAATGVVVAADSRRYDPDSGIAFATYAGRYAWGHMQKYRRECDYRLARAPRNIGCPSDYAGRPDLVEQARKVAIGRVLREGDHVREGGASLGAILADRSGSRDRLAAEAKADVWTFLARLDARSREILQRHYGVAREAEETMETIGKSLGVSKPRILQIEHAALAKLRKYADAGAVA